MVIAGGLTREQTELLFTQMPLGIGFSAADEHAVVILWAGDGFATGRLKLIDGSLFDFRTALREAKGTCCGVLETAISIEEEGPADGSTRAA